MGISSIGWKVCGVRPAGMDFLSQDIAIETEQQQKDDGPFYPEPFAGARKDLCILIGNESIPFARMEEKQSRFFPD